jgi:hypothetical protein
MTGSVLSSGLHFIQFELDIRWLASNRPQWLRVDCDELAVLARTAPDPAMPKKGLAGGV